MEVLPTSPTLNSSLPLFSFRAVSYTHLSRGGRGGSAGRNDRRREFAATDRKGCDTEFSLTDRKDCYATFSPERRKPEQADADFGQMPGNVIVGRNPVAEALKSGREDVYKRQAGSWWTASCRVLGTCAQAPARPIITIST